VTGQRWLEQWVIMKQKACASTSAPQGAAAASSAAAPPPPPAAAAASESVKGAVVASASIAHSSPASVHRVTLDNATSPADGGTAAEGRGSDKRGVAAGGAAGVAADESGGVAEAAASTATAIATATVTTTAAAAAYDDETQSPVRVAKPAPQGEPTPSLFSPASSPVSRRRGRMATSPTANERADMGANAAAIAAAYVPLRMDPLDEEVATEVLEFSAELSAESPLVPAGEPSASSARVRHRQLAPPPPPPPPPSNACILCPRTAEQVTKRPPLSTSTSLANSTFYGTLSSRRCSLSTSDAADAHTHAHAHTHTRARAHTHTHHLHHLLIRITPSPTHSHHTSLAAGDTGVVLVVTEHGDAAHASHQHSHI
jgi:hypothetical protein